jgi:hypothetical protein
VENNVSGYAKDQFSPTREELLDILEGMKDEVRAGNLLTIAFSMKTPDENKQAVVYFGPAHILAATSRGIADALEPKLVSQAADAASSDLRSAIATAVRH